MEENRSNRVKEPAAEYGPYSYADYLLWDLEERVEIIKGRYFKMNAAPKRLHQKISLHIATELYQFLKGKPCEVYEAPFDVRLPVKSLKNEESGVKEYWIIHPNEQTLLVYTLKADKYVPSRLFTSGDSVKSARIEGFVLDLESLFKEMD